MADKTALNTGYTHFADLIMAYGFAEASGDFRDLVAGINDGVTFGTIARVVDPTHGEALEIQEDAAGMGTAHKAIFDGLSQFTVAMLVQNDANTIPGGSADAQWLFNIAGSGADQLQIGWANSENVFGDATFVTNGLQSQSIVDGLDDIPTVALGTSWNVIGLTYDGSDLFLRINNTKGPGIAIAADVLTTVAHIMIFGNREDAARGWLGRIAGVVAMDVGLNDTDWNILQANFVDVIFAAGVDTTPPVITLTGANPQTIVQNDPYVELGATAVDNVDGDISGNIVINATNVNTAVIGSYSVTYDVQDAALNSAIQVSRTVDVVAPSGDVDPPDETGSAVPSASLSKVTVTKSLTSDEAGTGWIAVYAEGSTAPIDGAAVETALVGAGGCVAVGTVALVGAVPSDCISDEFDPALVDVYTVVKDTAGNYDDPEAHLALDYTEASLISGGGSAFITPAQLLLLAFTGEYV